MSCDRIRPVIRPFLDDLLDDREYLDIHLHLETCERCRAYASSVGTLSYRLYELGQAALPPDMVSTILYESKKQGPPAPSGGSDVYPFSEIPQENIFAPGLKLFWIWVLAVLVVTVAVIASVAGFKRFREETPAAALAPSAAAAQKVNAARPVLSDWHCHLPASLRPELAELIREMHLEVGQESANLLVLQVPKGEFGKFKDRVSALSGFAREFGEPDLSRAPGDSIQASIYFE